jgi:hypothetical protein
MVLDDEPICLDTQKKLMLNANIQSLINPVSPYVTDIFHVDITMVFCRMYEPFG